MAVALLDRAIYSYPDVDRLVGLQSGTAGRWLDGDRRNGRFYEPVLRAEPTGSDSVTWGEVVEARLLAEFRSRDVPVQRLRPAINLLRAEFGRYPLAHARPFFDVEGRELVRIVQEQVGCSGNCNSWWSATGNWCWPTRRSGSTPRSSTTTTSSPA